MITEDKSTHKTRTTGGLENKVPQNSGLQENDSLSDKTSTTVNNGGVATAKYDLHLEKQWLAVQDEYLANFPETEDIDTNNEHDSLEALISNIAKRRQKSKQEIHDEIMNWNADNEA
ncbi:hypothetical protein [Maribacter sp. Asnod1-A12]|uniref:hypothetical protein n=1 Tax=Maribacter sp. Asnod1-A12 TaxID=3160576 RepID=UPI0038678A0D